MFNWRKREHTARRTDSHDGRSVEPRCSFCDKTSSDDVTLIAGPSVFICNECVDVCVDILVQRRDSSDVPPVGATGVDRLLRERARACGLCGRLALAVLPIESRGVLCGECADAVEDALSRGEPQS